MINYPFAVLCLLFGTTTVGRATNHGNDGMMARTNFKGCVKPEERSDCYDYFPDKIVPQFSEHWNMTYHGSYKILHNTQVQESYLMYQCGTDPPASEEGKHDLVIPVPLQGGIALSQTVHINQMEQLGLRRQIKAYIGGSIYISSPCLNTLVNEGNIEEVHDTTTWHEKIGVNVTDYVRENPDIVIIHGGEPKNTSGSVNHNIIVSESKEGTNRAVFEWHKVFGSLYNLEKEANDQFEASSKRFDCGTDNAKYLSTTVLAEKVKPTVLWGYFVDYMGWDGNPVQYWNVATCDPKYNYYCEFADHCQSNLLHKDNTATNMELSEFIEFGKNADVWIYSGFNWNDVYAEFNSSLADFASVQNNKVYDLLGSGSSAWFEQRSAEYDVVLQDFCDAVGHTDQIAQPHNRMWLRKALPLNVEPVGSLGSCTIDDIDNQWESRASECTYLDTDAIIPEQPTRLGPVDAKEDCPSPFASDSSKTSAGMPEANFFFSFWTVASVMFLLN